MGHLLLRVLWHGDKHWCSDLDLDKFSTTVQHQTHFNILIYSFGENASTARTLYTVLSRGLQTDGSAPRSDMCLFYISHTHSASLHIHIIRLYVSPCGGLTHARWPGWRLWRTVHIVLDMRPCDHGNHTSPCDHAYQCMPMYNLTQDVHTHYTGHTHRHTHTHIDTLTKLSYIFSLSPFFRAASMSSSWHTWRKQTCWRGSCDDEDAWGQWSSPMESWWFFSKHVCFSWP